jgi:hypothetical protein
MALLSIVLQENGAHTGGPAGTRAVEQLVSRAPELMRIETNENIKLYTVL